jgi:hypothetical protein
MGNIFGLYLLIVVLFAVVPAVVIVWAVVDAATRPIWAWQFAQRRKGLWLALLLLGLVDPFPIGVTLVAIYVTVVRPKVATAQQSALDPVVPAEWVPPQPAAPWPVAAPPVWPRPPRAVGRPRALGPADPMAPPVPLPPPMVVTVTAPMSLPPPTVPPVAPPVPVASGWYPDPYRDSVVRFWNGDTWTKAVRRSRDTQAPAKPPPRNGARGLAAGVRTNDIDSNGARVD